MNQEPIHNDQSYSSGLGNRIKLMLHSLYRSAMGFELTRIPDLDSFLSDQNAASVLSATVLLSK
jgi:hypothetical protein